MVSVVLETQKPSLYKYRATLTGDRSPRLWGLSPWDPLHWVWGGEALAFSRVN